MVEYKDFNDEKVFVNLESLIEIVLSFPHSNAGRIFSMVTDIKNKKRNRLSNDMISAICVVRSSFETENINCTNFEIDSRHLELHKSIWRYNLMILNFFFFYYYYFLLFHFILLLFYYYFIIEYIYIYSILLFHIVIIVIYY